mgnify:CR=1 FL=1
MVDVLEHLVRAPATRAAVSDLNAWFARLGECPFTLPIDRALWAGFAADRLGYAFVGGYRAALARLFTWGADALAGSTGGTYVWPSIEARLSLAATEARGAHPRAIETTLSDESGALVLRGVKTFATLASAADELLVVASRGIDPDGKPRLVLVRVRSNACGVRIEDRAPTPFAPEIPHARVTLADVMVTSADVLPGDGYAVYLKPFRTIEDTLVLAAALGHVLGAARAHGFAPSMAEGALALAIALREVAARSPADPVAHLTLAGLFTAAKRLIAEHDPEWEKADATTRDRWRRDLGLLMIAETAHQQRTSAAWTLLGSQT